MGLWTVQDKKILQIARTKFNKEKVLEQNLEDWIERDSSILGEPLLIIGRQVKMPDTKDRIDLLGFDLRGRATIIELKRGELKDPVDIQALRYASYLSRWKYDTFEAVARHHLGSSENHDFNLYQKFEEFCGKAGEDQEETPKLNVDQRVIIAGSDIRDKLGSVALWLHEHHIDIKLVEVQVYKEGGRLFLQPSVIVPTPVSRFSSIGTGGDSGELPWITAVQISREYGLAIAKTQHNSPSGSLRGGQVGHSQVRALIDAV